MSISSVHLRLEDELSHAAEPVAAGVVIESLTVKNAEVLVECTLYAGIFHGNKRLCANKCLHVLLQYAEQEGGGASFGVWLLELWEEPGKFWPLIRRVCRSEWKCGIISRLRVITESSIV